ncbi:hypothetical protein IAU59_006201 [Kwoniella sp. CBS 9459]
MMDFAHQTPPLPLSLITTLLPHLLPPGPLPQELLCKALLQRLLYIPPSADDLDSHLTPFPASARTGNGNGNGNGASRVTRAADGVEDDDDDEALDQPISSRLKELSHGHRLGEVVYTREGEEVYAKIDILPEHGEEGLVEIWFEFEGQGEGHSEEGPSAAASIIGGAGNGRGWVYHSARIPATTTTTTSVTGPIFYSNVDTLPPPPSEDRQDHATSSAATDQGARTSESGELGGAGVDGMLGGGGEAPAGYWAAFDSPPAQAHDQLDVDDHDNDHAEDAYWAQYSRPATAPITPAPMTPGGPLNPASMHQNDINLNGIDSFGNTNGNGIGIGSGFGSGWRSGSSSSSNGFRSGGQDDNGTENENARKLAESLRSLGLQDNQYNTKPALVSDGFKSAIATSGFGNIDLGHSYDPHDVYDSNGNSNGDAGDSDTNVKVNGRQVIDGFIDNTDVPAPLFGSDNALQRHGVSQNTDVDSQSSRNTSSSTSTSMGRNRDGSESQDKRDHESSGQVKDRLRGKIAHALNVLWKEYCPTSSTSPTSVSPRAFDVYDGDGDEHDHRGEVPSGMMIDPALIEERALGWLRLARTVLEPPSVSVSQSKSKSRAHASVFPSHSQLGGGTGIGIGGNALDERVIAKLEVLWEMYAVLQEGQGASDNFYRLVEGVIKRQAMAIPGAGAGAGAGDGYGNGEDEIMRQETYYE